MGVHLLLLVLLILQLQHSTALINANEVAALQALRNSWQQSALNWTGNDPCGLKWQGISCSNETVIGLDLNGKELGGRLPSAIGALKNLKTLSLQKNSLSGAIPPEIGNLTSLTVLKLGANGFTGLLPGTINKLSELRVLSLHHNKLNGRLPELTNLTKISDMFLQWNDFAGPIPSEVGSFELLRTLSLTQNHFSGPVPQTFSQLSRLSTLYIDSNMLSGPFPNITGLGSIQYLYMKFNQFSGPIPSDIGYLTSLQNMGIEENDFSGPIPSSILQLSNLPYLYLQHNNLSGPLPDLSGLLELQGMSLSSNSFELFEIPTWMSSLQSLQLLYLAECGLRGTFPSALIFGLQSLTKGEFGDNKFNGTLDLSGVGKNLTTLILKNNLITDVTAVPSSLQILLLGGNPVCDDESFNFPNFCELDNGPEKWTWRTSCPGRKCLQPDEVLNPVTCNWSFAIVATMQLSSATFRTLTASRIGTLQRQLARSFEIVPSRVKIISASFSNKTSSVNATTVVFPDDSGFWRPSELRFIDKQLKQPSILSGNGVYKLVNAKWPQKNVRSDPSNLKKVLSISLPILVFSGLILCGYIWWRLHETRKRSLIYGVRQELERHSLRPTFFQYQDLKQATRDFDSSNKLGEGSFGQVYKGLLPDDTQIAVKRLFPARIKQGAEEFVNEVFMITAVLHRNLVKLIGCCIEGPERILVYEFLKNNSLQHALFGENKNLLDWPQRFEIAVGTARGLAYLHEDCQTRIVHRDIKASNILLDEKMNPKIADFGLARLFPDGDTHVSTRVAGTYGYVAPEYALYGHLTEKADTFSFGIVLLELVTGRKSIAFEDDDIVLLLECVWQHFLEGRTSELLPMQDFDRVEFHRLLQVGLLCSQANASRRPRMSHVVTMLLGEREVEMPSMPGIVAEIAREIKT